MDATGAAGPKLALPTVPQLTAPSNGTDIAYPDLAQGITLLLWSAVPDASAYRVMVDFSPSFARPLFDRQATRATQMELRALEARRRTPIYRATAISGVGVLETLQGLLGLVWDHLDSNYALGEKLQTERQSFMEQVFRDWNPQRVRSSGFGS